MLAVGDHVRWAVSSSRYQRQEMLPGIGAEGQARLAAARVAIAGVGALGCAAADMLARAGAGLASAGGWLMLVDRDVVEWTNLQRQCLFGEADARAGAAKVEAAAGRLREVNAEVRVRAIAADVTGANAERVLGFAEDGGGPSLLLDGTDNFATRYVLNDLSVKHRVPYCYAGVVGTCGAQATFVPGVTGCLRCVVPTPPDPGATPGCDTAGVLGAAVQIVAGAQVADAIKILTGNAARLSGSMLSFDLWSNRRTRVALAADLECGCCAGGGFEFLGLEAEDSARLCGQNAVQVCGAPGADAAAEVIDLARLESRLAGLGPVVRSGVMLRFDPAELPGTRLTIFADGRAIVRGTSDPARARSVYARYVGA